MKDLISKNEINCFVIMPFGVKGEYKRGEKESRYIFRQIILKSIKAIHIFRSLARDDFPVTIALREVAIFD